MRHLSLYFFNVVEKIDGVLEGPHFLALTKRAGKRTLIFIFEKSVCLSQKTFVGGGIRMHDKSV